MRLARVAVCMLTLVALVPIVGCDRSSIEFVATGKTYSESSVLALTDSTDPGAVAKRPTADAPTLRRRALVELRKQGDDAQNAADLITATFPVETPGVPLAVQKAQFGGKPALIIIEAIGRRGGTLNDKRVWVLDESGRVVFAGTR